MTLFQDVSFILRKLKEVDVVQVFDEFVKDYELLTDIEKDLTFYDNIGRYYWWDGVSARTVKQRLIRYIWMDNYPADETYEISGFEYWTGCQSSEIRLGYKNHLQMHKDKDETLYRSSGKIVPPKIGSVYYPHDCSHVEGGDLLIYSKGDDQEPEVVKPVMNRLVIFDAGSYSHCVAKVTNGLRRAIAINLWEDIPFSKKSGQLSIE